MIKYCPSCNEDLAMRYFGKNRSTKDGLQPYCKDCRKAYYDQNKAKILGKQKKYYRKNRLRRIACSLEYQKKHPEVHKKACRKYDLNHKEQEKLYYQNNRAKILKKVHEYRKHNPDKIKRLAKVSKARWRAREKLAEGRFNHRDIINIYNEQHGLCYYCHNNLFQEYHIDHKIPLSRKGTNWPNNLCCACINCNLRKHNMTDKEFITHLNRFKEN